MFISQQKAVLTAALCLTVGISPASARADNSVIIDEEQLIFTLNAHLYSSLKSLPSSDEFQTAAVCFVNDTRACNGDSFGGNDNDFELNDKDRCFNEGYKVTDCPDGYKPGGKKCPYGPYYSDCVSTCPSSYVTCEPPYHGVGEACDGKYASCECTPCGEGYDYTTIPEGYIADGDACVDCDGVSKYKIKINPCDGFQDCGVMGPDTGAQTCMSGSQIKYDNCKPCPNLGTLSSCPSPFICTLEECSNRYYKSGCEAGYDWDSSAQTCTPQCASTYKYTCTGANQTGGSGTACNGKYAACTCSSPYSWISGACSCSSSFKYTCTGTGYSGGSGTVCGGKYTACTCSSGYFWSGESCAEENACMKGSQLGYILNSDMTVTSSKQSGKTPIGVVVCSYSGGGGQAMALKSIGGYYKWESYDTDISTLTNYTSTSAASKDYDSCGNTAKIIAAGDKSTYPAAWAAHEYSTEGTSAGDWCLPAAGIFTSYYINQDAINTGLSRANGTKFTTDTSAWSSSEYSYGIVWASDFYITYGLSWNYKNSSFEVRPVIEFQEFYFLITKVKKSLWGKSKRFFLI